MRRTIGMKLQSPGLEGNAHEATLDMVSFNPKHMMTCLIIKCIIIVLFMTEGNLLFASFLESKPFTYVDIQGSRGLVCGRVTDEHGLQAVGELQASINPLVFWRANYITDHPPHSRIGHSERRR